MTLSEVKAEISRLYKLYREQEARCTSAQKPAWRKQFAEKYHVEYGYGMSTAPIIVDDTCIVKDVIEFTENKKTLFGSKTVITRYSILVFYNNNEQFSFWADKNSGAEKLLKGQTIRIHGKAKGGVDFENGYTHVYESEHYSFQFTY